MVTKQESIKMRRPRKKRNKATARASRPNMSAQEDAYID